jgi:hydroxylamine dehydrogenase
LFRAVFVAVVIGTALIIAAYLIHTRRPSAESEQPTPALIRASGRCAECHSNQQYSVVHEYELSAHARKGISCLECHQPAEGQKGHDHHGFSINAQVTAANCRTCHERVYQQYVRSRHAAVSWAAVYGEKDFTAEQVAQAEQFHPGFCKRPANALASREGGQAISGGCVKCHAVGKPNADGSIGTCTACHTRHTSSVQIARLPTTCGQCHMGPDHSQIEIYEESKHGVLFHAQQSLLNLAADPKKLSTRDMFIPTCATCHMSGLNGLNVTHDTSERLSYNLATEISEKRPNFSSGQANMKDLCLNCHTRPVVERVYKEGDKTVEETNAKVKDIKAVYEGLRKDGVLQGKAFEHPVDFEYFDLWHYHARTVKHGAFMGGADFVQWHGNYPLLKASIEIKAKAEELRRGHAKRDAK